MGNSLIRNQIGQIRELLDQATGVGIIIGENQNTDTVAAALSLYLALSSSGGKSTQIISKKEPTVEVSSLFGVNKITKSFEGNTKILTISVPYREGEIEKVSYNIEQDKLNVNLFAEENGISFDERDIEYIRKGSTPSLVITIGVTNEAELKGFVDPKSIRTIHIDKNMLNSLTGDVSLVDSSLSSLSEIVAEIIISLNLPVDVDIAQNLMDGITYATRNFTLPTTSAYAFEAAGFLLQAGAKRKERGQDRGRRDTFPQESHFLNRQPRNVGQVPQPRSGGQRPDTNQPQYQPSVPVATSNPQAKPDLPEDDFPADLTQPNINKASGEGEEAMSEEIPEDWFLPKVFKGSKRGN